MRGLRPDTLQIISVSHGLFEAVRLLVQSFDAESVRQRSLVQQIIDKLACMKWVGAWDILTGDSKAIICRVFLVHVRDPGHTEAGYSLGRWQSINGVSSIIN